MATGCASECSRMESSSMTIIKSFLDPPRSNPRNSAKSRPGLDSRKLAVHVSLLRLGTALESYASRRPSIYRFAYDLLRHIEQIASFLTHGLNLKTFYVTCSSDTARRARLTEPASASHLRDARKPELSDHAWRNQRCSSSIWSIEECPLRTL